MTRFIMSPFKSNYDENKAITNKLKKLSKNGEFFSNIIYMRQKASLKLFSQNVKNDDVIELHAEGIPWEIGTLSGNFDYTPLDLANFFKPLFLEKQDICITIELRACNSGTIANGSRGDICFAREFSKALASLNLNNITVKGYAGFVQSENPFKQSVVAHASLSRAKLAHCKLFEAEATYRNGVLIKQPEKTIVTEYTYEDSLRDKEPSLIRALSEKEKLISYCSIVESLTRQLSLFSLESLAPVSTSTLQSHHLLTPGFDLQAKTLTACNPMDIPSSGLARPHSLGILD